MNQCQVELGDLRADTVLRTKAAAQGTSLGDVQVTQVAYRVGQSKLPHEFQGGSRTGIRINGRFYQLPLPAGVDPSQGIPEYAGSQARHLYFIRF